MTDLKRGKRPASHDTRDLQFLNYRAAVEAIPIARIGYHHDIPEPIGMLGNDRYGDCVFAGAAHETMLWNATQARAVPFTDAAVLGDYGAVTGFTPADPASDQGTDVHEALAYRRNTGIADAAGLRHKLGAYVALEPGNWRELLEALEVFEAVGIGFRFPDYAMDQFHAGLRWSYRVGGTIEGGHYVPLVGRSHVSTVTTITWGQKQDMTRAFFHAYCTAGEHRALTADLRWMPTGDLKPGDALLAFDEMAGPHGRFYRNAEVLSNKAEMQECLAVEMSDGSEIITTPDHLWLSRQTNGGWRWLETRRLCAANRTDNKPAARARHGTRFATKLPRLIEPWSGPPTYGDGWLAGLLDGEGTLSHPCQLSFAQNEGVVLDRAFDELARLGLLRSVRVRGKSKATGVAVGFNTPAVGMAPSCRRVYIWGGRMMDRVALLGKIRPERMLAKFDPDLLGRVESRSDDPPAVINVRRCGRREIAKVTTTSGTLIVEGHPMHNCDEAWGLLSAEMLGADGLSAEGFDYAALQADVAALG